MIEDGVDLHGAADLLGVHYQTAYKWVRGGQLPAVVVRGRYLLDRADVAAFAERRDRPQPRRVRRPRLGFAVLADRMFDHLVAGDERRARRLAAGLLDDGVRFTTVMAKVLVPALRRIGDEWHGGRLTVWAEHRASAIVERLIGNHHQTPRGRRRGTAVVAAVANDLHALPTSMAAAALREDNWTVHHLGADVPGDELVRFCAEHPVDLAVLTVTTAATAKAARRVAADLAAHGIRSLVGEPGASLRDLQQHARASRQDHHQDGINKTK